jgi:ribulose-phosphate 3-epimerase
VGWNDWVRTVEVEPSLYAADFAHLGDQIDVLLRAGVRIFHFDVGDGHFIEPITIGPIVLQSISQQIHEAGALVDCHLMTESPERHFVAVAAAGGDSVTVHYEACEDLPAVVRAARANNLQVGLAFKPETSAAYAAHAALASRVDIVLCMSIEPGYSGQEFMPEAYERIRTVRSLLPPDVPVQVDGGIGPDNIRAVRDAGASLFVAGSSIFGREDLPRAYRRLVQELSWASNARSSSRSEGAAQHIRIRWSARLSSATVRSSPRVGTSARAGRTPRSWRSTRRASARGARRST